ncbi:LysR family transcriptional regulator, partial [Pseudomonas aeruginosa]
LAPPGQGGLRPLRVRELPDDLDELHTRYGIVSRAGYSLSPLAEAMIDELKRVDDAT